MLRELLDTPGVVEECDLRGRIGFMAIHGGELEKVTDIVAREAAEQSDASYYGVLHPAEPKVHIASTAYDPAHSVVLAGFLHHIDVAIAIHGYGRDHLRHTLLIGGRNRKLASIAAAALSTALPDEYQCVDDVAEIPKGLRGQHSRNPVNLPRSQGVQIELPPTIRWNYDAWGWSDHGEAGRAPQVDQLIAGLVHLARGFRDSDDR